MKRRELVKTIPLAGTEKGIITIARVEEPYGEDVNVEGKVKVLEDLGREPLRW